MILQSLNQPSKQIIFWYMHILQKLLLVQIYFWYFLKEKYNILPEHQRRFLLREKVLPHSCVCLSWNLKIKTLFRPTNIIRELTNAFNTSASSTMTCMT